MITSGKRLEKKTLRLLSWASIFLILRLFGGNRPLDLNI